MEQFIIVEDNPQLYKAYQLNNYLVETRGEGYRKIGIVYFSSNNLYYPNTKEVFEKTIFQKNRFEWTKRRAVLDERDEEITVDL